MIARRPGHCVLTGRPIAVGDEVRWSVPHAARVLVVPAARPPAPIEPPTRAQVSRHARNRAHGAHLDHEAE